MGRKEDRSQAPSLGVKIPSYFRCPISLDVMKSPVSLCTGVTYDRSSIIRWLESGNKTCPATMQPLASTDLVPNLTLQRLIDLWSASKASNAAAPLAPSHPAADLIGDLGSSPNPAPSLRRIADFLLDDDNDDFEKNRLVISRPAALAASLCRNASQIEALEAAARLLALILAADFIEERAKNLVISSLASDLDASIHSLISLLKEGKNLESRVDAARILHSILSALDPDSAALAAEKPDLVHELLRLAGPTEEGGGKERMDGSAVGVGLACLVRISGLRRVRSLMVKKGVVVAAKNVLTADSPAAAAVGEKALKLLEMASGLAEGRSAICEAADELMGVILGRMMKVGREGTEAAIAVLWSVCHLFRDQRAVDAVKAADGGITRILLLMQSDCSPAVRRMSGELLKVFRVNSKCCISGYDTKTTHIMPF